MNNFGGRKPGGGEQGCKPTKARGDKFVARIIKKIFKKRITKKDKSTVSVLMPIKT